MIIIDVNNMRDAARRRLAACPHNNHTHCAFHKGLKILSQRCTKSHIQSLKRIVKNEEHRTLEQRPRDGNLAPLAVGEFNVRAT